ncbi:transcriptional regulator, MarR family [Streptococcus infantarius subsp. infantarius]|nr:transcriptional regulator, MarR family [Streptococcus infantarius subsp. infantarius]
MPEQYPTLTNQLCFAIYNANRVFNQFYKQKLAKFDLTYTQYIVLLALWETDNLALRELGKQLDLASNTLTPLLKRLEEKCYLTRIRPEEDQRQLIVSLTQTGKALQADVEQELHTCVGEFNPALQGKIEEMIEDNHILIEELKKML